MRAFYHKSVRGIYCSVPRRIGSPAPVQYYCSKFAPELQHKHTKKSSKFNHANLYKKARQSPVLLVRDYFIVFFRICKWGNSEYYRKVFASISVSLVNSLHFTVRARSHGNVFQKKSGGKNVKIFMNWRNNARERRGFVRFSGFRTHPEGCLPPRSCRRP